MFLNLLLLLFSFINYSETPPVPVTGKKGSNVTLPCQHAASKISHIDLRRFSKSILTCQNEECESDDRVSKKGSCDIILMDLRLSDNGKYRLKVHYNKTQTELDYEITEYHLHIHDEISVKIDGELKLDIILPNADKVEHQISNDTEWTEVWKKDNKVQSDRLNISNETLTISNFTVSDTGTYRVLDYEGEIWITVTVTEYGIESKGKLDTNEDKTKNEDKTNAAVYVVPSVIGALLVLVIPVVIWKCKRQHAPVPREDSVRYTANRNRDMY